MTDLDDDDAVHVDYEEPRRKSCSSNGLQITYRLVMIDLEEDVVVHVNYE